MYASQTVAKHLLSRVLEPVPAGVDYILLPVFVVPTLQLDSMSELEPVLPPTQGPRAGRTWDRLLHSAGARCQVRKRRLVIDARVLSDNLLLPRYTMAPGHPFFAGI